jgi:hypothetical protein
MATFTIKIKAFVSLALLFFLAVTLITGDEDEENSFLLRGENLHKTAAYVTAVLTAFHIYLNAKLMLVELRSLLGFKKKSDGPRI